MVLVKTAAEVWEKLQARLRQSQLIQDILAGTEAVGKTTGADKVVRRAREKVSDRVEDAKETWETSQHPLVYQASSVWDSMTAETEAGAAQRLLRRLDPYFDVEEWKADLVQHLLPEVMGAWLRGDADTLRQWLSGAVLSKLLAEVEARKKADRIMDPHVLDIRNADVIAYKIEGEHAANPVLLVLFMVQQIDCVRNSKGEVVAGSEDRIAACHYIFAMRREYEEANQELRWRVADFMLAGQSEFH
ncbi:tim44-like protein [Tribonema minus]|uniref:Tim44-like protein n=1 Tax=Tribonema minus TaxID=303371 RepID=A0A836CIX3_9STRA|nr:tim44-like protein [Tribonema minus]|eukprot:TRINITY_DN13167_c1_g1_i1.p4 TRINITY_DN13167_c1_g1~~TRINITY_DN13167_c1_g1_i1.p4  ORF type:complete len:246 (+),score=121.78 TRINITY_DN13167_c1_g1_i1:845-1582(+)